MSTARLRGQDYLLERRMLRRQSTGEVIDRAFTQFSYPTFWHYDVLRGLDYLRAADVTPDERMAEAIDLVESKRHSDGLWRLEGNDSQICWQAYSFLRDHRLPRLGH